MQGKCTFNRSTRGYEIRSIIGPADFKLPFSGMEAMEIKVLRNSNKLSDKFLLFERVCRKHEEAMAKQRREG